MTTKVIAEYIWMDKKNNFRSKSRTLDIRNQSDIEIDNLPKWNYNGVLCGQSENNVILTPVAVFMCPFRGQNSILVLCETYKENGEPMSNNYRQNAVKIFNDNKEIEPMFELEQDYFIINPNNNKPLGFPISGYPEPEGDYFCSIGTLNNFGRKIADLHYKLCLVAGVNIYSISANVAPGQWKFQIGQCNGIEAGDHMMIARYILDRIGELNNVCIDYSEKPVQGNWNHSKCCVNYSTRHMRRGLGDKRGIDFITDAIKKLKKNNDDYVNILNYNTDTNMDMNNFITIPNEVNVKECGYFEDKRPPANINPYLLTSTILSLTMV
jgi:glutamine synthetase